MAFDPGLAGDRDLKRSHEDIERSGKTDHKEALVLDINDPALISYTRIETAVMITAVSIGGM